MSRQTLVMTSAGIAHVVELVHPGGLSMPTALSNWFTGPASGLNNMFHTTATATSEVMYGKKNAVRNTPIPRSFWLSSTARPRDAAMVSGIWPTAYQVVLLSAFQKASLLSIRLKLSNPIHFGAL